MHYHTSHQTDCEETYTGKSDIRVVHNVANGPDVDVALDNVLVLKNIPYKYISDYLEVKSGEHHLSVLISGTETTIFELDLDLTHKQHYTIVVHGDIKDLSSIAPLVLVDDLSKPARGKAHLRFVHADALVPKAGIDSVDIFAGQHRAFTNIGYGQIGVPSYLPVDATETAISVTPHDSVQIALGPLCLKLRDGGIYTIIASGGEADAPLTALVSEDNKC